MKLLTNTMVDNENLNFLNKNDFKKILIMCMKYDMQNKMSIFVSKIPIYGY